jgi:hypothetical protein
LEPVVVVVGKNTQGASGDGKIGHIVGRYRLVDLPESMMDVEDFK